jgi:hypothetical protein
VFDKLSRTDTVIAVSSLQTKRLFIVSSATVKNCKHPRTCAEEVVLGMKLREKGMESQDSFSF